MRRVHLCFWGGQGKLNLLHSQPLFLLFLGRWLPHLFHLITESVFKFLHALLGPHFVEVAELVLLSLQLFQFWLDCDLGFADRLDLLLGPRYDGIGSCYGPELLQPCQLYVLLVTRPSAGALLAHASPVAQPVRNFLFPCLLEQGLLGQDLLLLPLHHVSVALARLITGQKHISCLLHLDRLREIIEATHERGRYVR